MATRKRKSKKRFVREFRARVLKEFKRSDALKWLSERARTSYAHASRLLSGAVPRVNSMGQDNLSWSRLKSHLTPDEVELLEDQIVSEKEWG